MYAVSTVSCTTVSLYRGNNDVMKKRDIFKGNVKNPGEFLFIFILIGALMIGLLAFTVCDRIFRVHSEDNTDRRDITVASCTEKDGGLVLMGADNMRYEIYGDVDAQTAEAIAQVCSEGAHVTAYTVTATSKNNEDYYVVWALRDADTYVLTFDMMNNQYRQEHKPVIITFSVMLFLWGAIVAMSIIVGRHPERFSRGVKRLFFKDGYIR